MMNCQGFRKSIYAYLDGELETVETGNANEHLDRCESCRDIVRTERGVSEFLRARLRQRSEVPAPVRDSIRESLRREAGDTPQPEPSWLVRALASRWTPRLAMAAVVVVLLLVPVQRFLERTPALAIAAGERHGCHELESGATLPACCKDLDLGVGDLLGPPSPNVPVPDLAGSGLVLVRTTRCSFGDRVVNLLAFRDAQSRRYSLLMTDRGSREFKLMPRVNLRGVSQMRRQVRVDDDVHGIHDSYEMAIWMDQGIVYTCVGPLSSPAFDTVLEALQVAR